MPSCPVLAGRDYDLLGDGTGTTSLNPDCRSAGPEDRSPVAILDRIRDVATMIVVDTGVLFAVADAADHDHDACDELLAAHPGELAVTHPGHCGELLADRGPPRPGGRGNILAFRRLGQAYPRRSHRSRLGTRR